MGEERPLPNDAEAQPISFPPSVSSVVPHPNGASHVHGEEEPYTIRCICGFADDDGNTVLCEQCETWQHIECYYHPTLRVPEVHKCVECQPRILDSANANQRQKLLREVVNGTDEKKARKPGSRAHKRSKTKEPLSFPGHQVNGISHTDHLAFDRAIGSPRDQPPPNKRPKTAHRHSGSISNSNNNNATTHNPSRHGRTASNALRLASPAKPALSDCPPDYFSPEFINVHRTNTDYTPAQTNLFLNIGISDLLSTWLDDPETFAEATHGKSHADVFKQHPTPIDELETPVQKCIKEDSSVLFHGNHPLWPHLIADRNLCEGHFVGELIGSIGHLESYKAEPTNNWDRLRHPDHFVFFHPHLPIYIDCRSEGTILRYARRSCRPNLKMETIITGAREYHFCFIATQDIREGAELTVAWDLESDPRLRDALYRLSGSSSSLDDSQRNYLIRWVETVLSHFGDCACPSEDGMCLMERFDRRVPLVDRPQSKTIASRRKQESRGSPSRIAGTANSRAGSETRPREEDEDAIDNTSSPRSSRSRTSREATPSRHEVKNQKGSELSGREQKKLLQQEKLFHKLEQREELDQRKKKRRSGSTLNTPSATTFKPPAHSYFPISNPDTPVAGMEGRGFESEPSHLNTPAIHSPSNQLSNEHSPSSCAPSRTPAPDSAGGSANYTYAEATVQTEDVHTFASHRPTSRRPHTPLSQRLFRRSYLNRLRVDATAGPFSSEVVPPPSLKPAQLVSRDTDMSDSMTSLNKTASPKSKWKPPDNDSIMVDSNVSNGDKDASDTKPDSLEREVSGDSGSEEVQLTPAEKKTSEDPVWTGRLSKVQSSDDKGHHGQRPTNLHVDLPPRPFHSTSDANQGVTGIPSVSNPTIASPRRVSLTGPSASGTSMLAPLVTPNHASLTQPSPIKKKMSLSDYSQRLKSKTPNTEKPQNLNSLGSASPPSIGRSPSATNNLGDSVLNPSATDGEVGSVKQEPVTPQP